MGLMQESVGFELVQLTGIYKKRAFHGDGLLG
jgi:hypothetical protein